ncbi:zinc metalloprotease HtpX [Candidatus Omnitrophota bacterium]
MNQLKTFILLTSLTLLLIWVGQVIGGPRGAMFAFAFSLILNLSAYWFSDKLVLSMYRAKPVSEGQAPQLYQMVRDLTQAANLPMPKVYTIPQQGANAFATGRNPGNAAIAVTDGILNLLSEDELKGVLAHELAHVGNRDILIGSIAAAVAGAVMMVANMARWAAMFGGYSRGRNRGSGNIFGLIAISILAPIAALIIQMAISRSREYLADRTGANFLHSGIPLAGALEKLDSQARHRPITANPQSAHMFIVNPLSGRQSLFNLFSTHPPIQSRIERLKQFSF